MEWKRKNLPRGIQDRNQISGQIGRHAISLGLGDNESEGQEHAPEEAEGSSKRKCELELSQRPEETQDIERLWAMG